MLHVHQIKSALQIAGVASKESSLIVKGEKAKEGMQIDLLIDRADDVVNVCEMKFSKAAFVVTKAYEKKLVQRLNSLEQQQPNKTFHLTLISVNSLERNEYSDIFISTIAAESLFS